MGTQPPRDPETGQFTGQQAEGQEPAPAQPEGSPPGQAPESGWTPERAYEFIQRAGIDPSEDPFVVARRAQNWAMLEDERQAPLVYQQLKSRFEPEPEPQQPNPWEQFQQPEPEPQYQQPQQAQFQPPTPQNPQGVNPEQLRELLEYERGQMEQSVRQSVEQDFLIQNLNYELSQTGIDNQHALQFMMNTAYETATQQGVHPKQAVEYAKQTLEEITRAQGEGQQLQPQGQGEPPQTPPEGAAANPFQPPQSLEEAAEISRQYG